MGPGNCQFGPSELSTLVYCAVEGTVFTVEEKKFLALTAAKRSLSLLQVDMATKKRSGLPYTRDSNGALRSQRAVEFNTRQPQKQHRADSTRRMKQFH